MVCGCEEHREARHAGKTDFKCVWKSRRLKDAWTFVQDQIAETKAKRRALLPATVGNNPVNAKAILDMLEKKATEMRLRFRYLSLVPWRFATADTVAGAQECWRQVMSREMTDHDALTRDFMERFGASLDKRRQGGELDEDMAE